MLGAAMVGCYDPFANDSAFVDTSQVGGTGGTGGTGGDTGTGAGGTTTMLPDPKCTPSGTDTPIDAVCGVFVSPSGDDQVGKGTKENPFATIGKALGAGQAIYACADSQKAFDEAVVIDQPGVFLFGALSCETWTYDATSKTRLTAVAGLVPLTVKTGATAHVEDLVIVARDAPDLMPDEHHSGNSSIAILAEAGSTLELTRCDATAGNGAVGANGEPPDAVPAPASAGSPGADGCDNMQGEFGADGGQNTCAGVDSSGGSGGNGTKNASGADASDGKPMGLTAKGGLGQTQQVTCDAGGNGGNGITGLAGDPGTGAASDVIGSLSAQGFSGVSGSAGALGAFGQGGGGGGGARVCANGNAGPSGGGGGAGGCGGKGGKPGYGGGSSIALASLGASLLFVDTTLTPGVGGNGGAGASGQQGSSGGSGGTAGAGDAMAKACSGGKGGAGGTGGKGGGGRGGHALGLAYTGTAPDTTGVMFKAGIPGVGGAGEGSSGTGADGVASNELGF